jgi:hypothetical protein
MKKWWWICWLGFAGCSNAPIAGTLDTLFPSRPRLPDKTRPDGDVVRPPTDPLPEPDLPGRRLPPIDTLPDRNLPDRNLPELRPLDPGPRSDSLPPPRW